MWISLRKAKNNNFKKRKFRDLLIDPAKSAEYLKSVNFELQKWTMFLLITIFSFLILREIDIATRISKMSFSTEWPSLAWKGAKALAVMFAGVFVVRFLSLSLNKQFFSWIAVLLYVLYFFCIRFFVPDDIGDRYNKLEFSDISWGFITLFFPALIQFWSCFINRNISPIQSRANFVTGISNVFWAIQITFGVLLFNASALKGKSLELSNTSNSFFLSCEIVFSLANAFVHFVIFVKFRHIHKFARHISVISIAYVPMYIGFAIWLVSNATDINDWNSRIWIAIVAVAIIVLLAISFLMFAKNELKSSKILMVVMSFALLVVWAFVCLYIYLFKIADASFAAINIATVATAVLFFLMTYVNSRFTKLEIATFMLLVVVLALSSVAFYILNKMGLASIVSSNPILDPETFSLVLFLLGPGLFFSSILLRVVLVPFFIRSALNHEEKVEKGKVKIKKTFGEKIDAQRVKNINRYRENGKIKYQDKMSTKLEGGKNV